MRKAAFLSFALLLGAAPPPPLAGVSVAVRNTNGQPIANAVVTVRLVGRDTPGPRIGSGYAVRHQVYSFSPAKRFELKLYAREQNRTVRFDRAGPVALGCNIHDQMTAFLYVTDSAFTAKTDAAGNVDLTGVPAGPIAITVWHPYLRAPGNQVSRQVNLGGGARETFTVALRPPPPVAPSY